MPHAELKYSSDLTLSAPELLAEIEQIILRHDGNSGECKGRAYPTDLFHHTHLLVEIMMLKKDHRDAAFTSALVADLEAGIKAKLTQGCFFSLSLGYNDGPYVTNRFDP